MKFKLLRDIIIVFCVLVSSIGYTQKQRKLDSLRNLVPTTAKDTNLVLIYLRIGYQFQYSNQDTAIYYYEKAHELSKELDHPVFIAKSLNYLGIFTKDMNLRP